MQADQPTSRPAFRPGDRVRVVSAGPSDLSGEVLDPFEAWVLWHQSACRNLKLDWRAGQVPVALTVFGTRVPVWLDASLLEHDRAT